MPHETGLNLITFPRSGSVFLFNILLDNTFIEIRKSHSLHRFSKSFPIITIARNPFDSILSEVSMVTHYSPTKNIAAIIDLTRDTYLSSYKYFLDYADAILDYNLLIENPRSTLENICKFFDIKIKTPISINLVLEDKEKYRHLATSTVSKTYEAVKSELLKYDLKDEWELYDKAISSSVLVSRGNK